MRGHDTGLDYHRMMIADLTKMDAYARAIEAVIRPGDVVLDVGAGTGVLSMLAARAGAKRVHAVESMPVAELAHELVVSNGLSDIVSIHRADLVQLDPIEPVDRVIGDWMGRYLVDDAMFEAVAAAKRWLKPEGTMHPDRVRLLLAPVGDFGVPMVEGFELLAHGLDLRPARERALNSCYRAALTPAQLIGPPVVLHDWDCGDPEPMIDIELEFACERDGVLKGLAGFFEADLAPEVMLSTSPAHDTHWSQYLFPLEPRHVEAGDRFTLRVGWDGERWTWGDQQSDWTRHRSSVLRDDAHVDVAIASNAGTAAFMSGDLVEAEREYARASRELYRFAGDREAVWENLGLARMNLGRHEEAARAFLMALHSGPRPQASRYVVVCLANAGRRNDARLWMARYEAAYGPHPDMGVV